MVMFEWSGVNAARVVCRLGAQPKGTMIAAAHCLVPTVHSADGPSKRKMRKTLIATVVVAVAFPAFAQQQPGRQPANPDANTPAVNSPDSPPNPGAPVAGANSFTEGQAKSRIEAKGFTNVSGLQKDDAGVWRGKASQGGKAMNVSVDFQGNVVGK